MNQAEDLRRQEIYAHLGRQGFKPRINPQAVVQYAMDHNIGDLQEAAHRMQQDGVAQRAATPPQATRQAYRKFAQDLKDYGGVKRAVASQYLGLPQF